MPCGSALILALLLVAVAGLLTAGWVVLITARSGIVEQMTAASQRRIAFENSRALAQEFKLERVIPSTSGSAFSYNLSDPTWGGISVPAWGSAPMRAINKATVNHFNPGNGDTYTFDLTVTLRDGGANPQRLYQIKSRSPLLAGTILSSQTPTASNSIGSLAVAGASFVWRPTLLMTFTTNSYSSPYGYGTTVTFTNSGGTTLTMNNLALPRQTSNPRSGATLFDGEFDAIDNNDSAANSSKTNVTIYGGTVLVISSTPDNDNSDGVTWDGSGNVTITLSDSRLANIALTGSFSTLTLTGQATSNDVTADPLPAVLIVAEPSGGADLTVILAQRYNSRRLDLAIKRSAGNVLVQFSTSLASWRLLLELENSPVIPFTGTATIKGGIRSDRSLTLATGSSIQITSETDPKFLERFATRNAWVESFTP